MNKSEKNNNPGLKNKRTVYNNNRTKLHIYIFFFFFYYHQQKGFISFVAVIWLSSWTNFDFYFHWQMYKYEENITY